MSTTDSTVLTPGDYRFVGDHAVEFNMVSSGIQLQVGPGDYVTLAQEDIDAAVAHNDVILNYLVDASGVSTQAEAAEIVEETAPTKSTRGGAKT